VSLRYLPPIADKNIIEQSRMQLEYELQYRLNNVIERIKNDGIKDIGIAQHYYGHEVKTILRHGAQQAYGIGAEHVATKKKVYNFVTSLDLQNIRELVEYYYPIFWRRLNVVLHRNDVLLQKYDFEPRSELNSNYIATAIAIAILTAGIAKGTISKLGQVKTAPLKQAAIGVDILVWTTSQDELVCPECDELDGQEWAADDPDLKEPPDDTHDNCRCYLDVIPGEEADLSEVEEDDEITAEEF
jgi:hypothetical protein